VHTRKQTLRLIDFCKSRLPTNQVPDSLAEFSRQAVRLRLRTSRALLEKIRTLLAANEMNELLRILALEIKDRNAMMLLYDVLDSIARASLEARSRQKNRGKGKRRALEERFRRENPEKYRKVINALEEEARLRELPMDREIWPDHCHIWRRFFPFNTDRSLKKIQDLQEEEFSMLIYRFLAELAASARDWRTLNKFDWRRFFYSGFSRKDLDSLFKPRTDHLEVLNLENSADAAAIRRRYKELARIHHPDRGGDAATMAQINLAYAALTRRSEPRC